MQIHQCLFKILRKRNVTDGRAHGRIDNVETVYHSQTKFAGGGGGGYKNDFENLIFLF